MVKIQKLYACRYVAESQRESNIKISFAVVGRGRSPASLTLIGLSQSSLGNIGITLPLHDSSKCNNLIVTIIYFR